MNVIETRDLTKYYGSSRGIVDVTLSVKEGDLFGFIGPNGAGKSTLIRTLLGLISPTSGSATIFGKDIVKDRTEILSDVGYLPSEAAFYRGMKVSELLEFSAKMRKSDCFAEAKRLCERLELDTSKKISQLSLGNRKKVGIGRNSIYLTSRQADLTLLCRRNFTRYSVSATPRGRRYFFPLTFSQR